MQRHKKVVSWARAVALACSLLFVPGCENPVEYDVVLRGGTIYDGTGEQPYTGDIALDGDIIAAMGDLTGSKGKVELDVAGHVARLHG